MSHELLNVQAQGLDKHLILNYEMFLVYIGENICYATFILFILENFRNCLEVFSVCCKFTF